MKKLTAQELFDKIEKLIAEKEKDINDILLLLGSQHKGNAWKQGKQRSKLNSLSKELHYLEELMYEN